jgi:hypothetical protein
MSITNPYDARVVQDTEDKPWIDVNKLQYKFLGVMP